MLSRFFIIIYVSILFTVPLQRNVQHYVDANSNMLPMPEVPQRLDPNPVNTDLQTQLSRYNM